MNLFSLGSFVNYVTLKGGEDVVEEFLTFFYEEFVTKGGGDRKINIFA